MTKLPVNSNKAVSSEVWMRSCLTLSIFFYIKVAKNVTYAPSFRSMLTVKTKRGTCFNRLVNWVHYESNVDLDFDLSRVNVYTYIKNEKCVKIDIFYLRFTK